MDFHSIGTNIYRINSYNLFANNNDLGFGPIGTNDNKLYIAIFIIYIV